jgi:hypothetical protein
MANYIKITDLVNDLKIQGLVRFVNSKNGRGVSFINSHQNIPANFDVDDIYINLDCQRLIDKSRATKIMHIAKDFNTNMFSVPQLTKTSCGKMVCPDGAGRIVAAILNKVQLIPAQQLSKSNPNQSDDDFQAELFLSQDENAAKVTGWQYHRVAHTIGIPTNKSMATKHNRALDIQKVIDKLNNRNSNVVYGYEGTPDIDLSESYIYFSRGVFKNEYNPLNAKNAAGKRDAPELYESCVIYEKYCEHKVLGQNLEVFYYFLGQEAEKYSKVLGKEYGQNAIDDASRKLRFILQNEIKKSNGNVTRLSNMNLKKLFQNTNAANKAPRDIGNQQLVNEWNKIVLNKSLMSEYQNFV